MLRRTATALRRDAVSAWSTGAVLDELVAAARAEGLSVDLLDQVADVDTAADLAAVDLAFAPATRALLLEGGITHTAAQRARLG
jgi:glycosyltransferase A (GT-A) superfamily protein (DUF2064 family)